ncbi:hypothetical protein PVAG01_02420 [Phlyctema vagabunda]|uniref:Transcription elongation factor 1 homolog n=1 Tax=Phlyctema vagabunda TaxID=108571 RepID=A0ABR4PQM6_9HELO
MGKRKAAKKPQGKKKNEPLATTFSCLFCNHEKSVTVKIDKKGGVGQLACKVCDQKFQCGVNCEPRMMPPPLNMLARDVLIGLAADLSAAVDVYSEWVDACDAVAKDGGPDDPLEPSRHLGAGRGAGGRDRERGSDNDIIDDDDLDGGDGYGGDGIVADDEY